MDRSLLVGVHEVKRGNGDDLRFDTLELFYFTPRRQPFKAKTTKYEVYTTRTSSNELDLPIGDAANRRFNIDILSPGDTKELEAMWEGLSGD